MVFVMEVCVLCEVGIDLLSVVYMNLRLFVGTLASRKGLRQAVWIPRLHVNGCK